jgi:hypothetical protein
MIRAIPISLGGRVVKPCHLYYKIHFLRLGTTQMPLIVPLKLMETVFKSKYFTS